ncbi:MAG: family 1 glycosylhydrolase [Acidimicrobiales bacterium]|nr:family 1 glycosylhydrolase [Acidimicrobiales bacterium]HRW38956.1 family 1 glycosylhydrolase [Aquihabitans sp.]
MAFPEGFDWGAAIPSTDGRAPSTASDLGDAIDRGAVAGPGLGWPAAAADDVAVIADLGIGSVRLTFDWARLEPAPGRVDDPAVEELGLVVDAAREAGLAVWGCLHDGPLPGWFAVDEHGFGDPRARRYHWPRFVELAGEAFGDRVAGWVPVAEPNRWAQRGWIDGARPPFGRDDAEGFAEALEGILLATVDAALRLRGAGKPVASCHWYVPVAPARLEADLPPTPEAEVWAARIDEVHRGCWERLLREGTLVVPNRSPIEVPAAREAFDLLGLSYRHGWAVRGDGALLPYPQRTELGPDGTVAWPEGFGVALHGLAESFPDRPLVAEIGAMGDAVRAGDALREVLAIAGDAARGGMDLRGLRWRRPIDPRPRAGVGLVDHARALAPAGTVLRAEAHRAAS